MLTFDRLAFRYFRGLYTLHHGNMTEVAKAAGIDRRTLYRRVDGWRRKGWHVVPRKIPPVLATRNEVQYAEIDGNAAWIDSKRIQALHEDDITEAALLLHAKA